MEVFPLFNDNELYGAIQTGDHQFYRIENNLPTELEINAKFIHLWVSGRNSLEIEKSI